MNTILMCGTENGTETIDMLLAAIEAAHFGAVYICENTVSVIPPQSKTPEFMVIDNDKIQNLNTRGGIALFRKHIPPEQHIKIPPAFFAVIDSDSHEAADMLRGDGIQTVTCGLSQKDTVTFSSLESRCAAVSLQRGLKTIDGTDIGPADVPVSFLTPHEGYSLLAGIAVLLLSGVTFPDEGLKLKI